MFTRFDGRVGLKQFWRSLRVVIGLRVISLLLFTILFSALLEIQRPNWSETQTSMGIVNALFPALIIWFAIGLWPTLAIFTKRWHDQNKSGWWNLSTPPFVFPAAAMIVLSAFAVGYNGPLYMYIPVWASVLWNIIALALFVVPRARIATVKAPPHHSEGAGTDYDNEGKPIAYLGREADGELEFAGTAFLTLAGEPREKLERQIERLAIERPTVPQRTWRRPQWLRPELRVRVRHLAGGDTLRHATLSGLVPTKTIRP